MEILIFMIVLSSVFWQSSSLSAQKHGFLTYSVEDGLPQSQVTVIMQDSKQYLWFGTKGGGLSRFDGQDFFNLSTRDGMVSNYITTISEDDSGVLWIGTLKGLSKVVHQQVCAIESSCPAVHAIEPLNDSILILGTTKGLFHYNTMRDSLWKVDTQIALNDVVINKIMQVDSTWLYATGQGLFGESHGIYTDISICPPGVSCDVKSIAVDDQGKMWFPVFGYGVVVMDEDRAYDTTYQEEAMRYAQTILIDGGVWIGSQDQGLLRLDSESSSWYRIDQEQGLPHHNVTMIYQDTWGNVWVATSGGGVARYLGERFMHIDQTDGLQSDRIYAVAIDTTETLWMSVSNYGIACLTDGVVISDVDSGRIKTKVNDILIDDEQRVWCATSGQGIFCYQDGVWTNWTEEDGLPGNWIKSLAIAGDKYYAATFADGIIPFEWEDSIWTFGDALLRGDGLTDVLITTLSTDNLGRIWYGTKQGGVGYIVQNTITGHYLPDRRPVNSIVFNDRDRPYIGTSGGGIYAYSKEEKKYNAIKGDSKLSSMNAYQLVFDADGALWMGSERGVDKITLDLQGDIESVEHFGRSDGFVGIETCQDAALLDSDGYLWFGTLKGLTRYQSIIESDQNVVPQVHFEEIDLSYESMRQTRHAHHFKEDGTVQGVVQLKRDENHLSFVFYSVQLDNPKVMYQWKLENIDTDWSPFTSRNSVSFADLRYGDYSFHVRAVDVSGTMSPPQQMVFSIDRAIWETVWFRVLSLGALLTGLIAFYRLRIHQLRTRAKAKTYALSLQNDLLQLEQKALQLQMNPHFVFNTLNSIQSLVALNKNDIARDQLQGFAQLMRGILNNSRSDQISLKDEIDVLRSYIEIEQFCQKQKFDYHIDTDGIDNSEEVMIPPMIIQPYVENAIVHGFNHLDRQGRLTVLFNTDADVLICTIEDNGIGRKRSEKLKSSKHPGHQSLAMQVNAERLQHLNREGVKDHLIIMDIVADGVVTGTRVAIKIPLIYAYDI